MTSNRPLPSNRSKLTVACLACRQRRAKCSGSKPCDFCSKHNVPCSFDHQHKRRGPRPRIRSDPSRQGAHQPLAPAPAPAPPVPAPAPPRPDPALGLASRPAPEPVPTSVSAPTAPDHGLLSYSASADVVIAAATAATSSVIFAQSPTIAPLRSILQPSSISSAPVSPVTLPSLGRSHVKSTTTRPSDAQDEALSGINGIDVEDLDNDSSNDDLQTEFEHGGISLADEWQGEIAHLLSQGEIAPSAIPVDLACHLIDLFWQTASFELRSMIDARSFMDALWDGCQSLSLCLAFCTHSTKYSCHPKLKEIGKTAFAQSCEHLCRTRLSFHRNRIGIGDIQASLVLADTMCSNGSGAQAWLDLTSAKGLTQLFRLDDQQQQHLHQEALSRIDTYIYSAELMNAIGNPSLQRWEHVLHPPGNQLCRLELLQELRMLFLRVQSFCLESFTRLDPPPWQPLSAFKDLQNQVEEYPIKRQVELALDPAMYQQDSEGSCVMLTNCVLTWHCCVILLNRQFLFVPTIGLSETEACQRRTRYKSFPSAPGLFLNERVTACESSAAAVCIICRELVTSGYFLKVGPFMGYALVTSALVLLNQLHCRRSLKENDVVGNLKIAFTILGALKIVYAPAIAWIRLLFHVHDPQSIKKDFEASESVFGLFFGRFVDAREVGMMTWWPPETHGTIAQTDDNREGAQRNGLSMPNGDMAENSVAPWRSDSWIQTYTAYLDEGMTSGGEIASVAPSFDMNKGPPPKQYNTAERFQPAEPATPMTTLDEPLQLPPGTQQPASRPEQNIPFQSPLPEFWSPDAMNALLDSSANGELLEHLFLGDQFWVDNIDLRS